VKKMSKVLSSNQIDDCRPMICALVVGQSPRPEIEAEFRQIAGETANLVLRGALDGLSRSEIDSIQPHDESDVLFTRLPNGDGVRLSKKQVVYHGSKQLDQLRAQGFSSVLVLCTGVFSEWASLRDVLFPSQIVAAMVNGVLPTGTLGVFSPLIEQCAQSKLRWQDRGYDVHSFALSPNASDDEVIALGKSIPHQTVELLVLDCVSYTRHTKRILSAITSVPAILGVSAAFRVALELVE
jgi:protein AroM